MNCSRQQICLFFRYNSRSVEGAAMSAPPCMYVQATRVCIYGDACPFSHDIQPALSKRYKEPSPVSE